MEWHSGSHTNSLIPFYAKGPKCIKFWIEATRVKGVSGKVLDNTALAKTIFSVLE